MTSPWMPVQSAPTQTRPPLSNLLRRILLPLDWCFHKLYGPETNPTYQSGVLALLFCAVAILSGLVLVLLYRVSTPYDSVAVLQAHPVGAWLRAIHRYSSDLAVLAVLVHLVKMLVGGRNWGARTRAWISGILLTGLLLFIGVTGLIMVWDQQAQRIALAAVTFVGRLPLFSEPPARIFGENALLGEPFFFMLMFLHFALPLLLVFLTWFHTSRVARPVFLPENRVAWFHVLALGVVAAILPLSLAPEADLLRIPGQTPLDLWYAFWVPLVERWGPVGTTVALAFPLLLLASIPAWWKPAGPLAPASHVDENLCTGCTQCVQDCPFDAIQMVPRSLLEGKNRSDMVARVDPDLCVSCGICAASCAPMGIGPPLRTGRDQLRGLDELLQAPVRADEVVVLACRWGCGEAAAWEQCEGVRRIATGCSGSVHTSVIESLLRRGAGGVLVVSCPPRDCSQREGAKWLPLRVYEDREAELQARVDRRRVRLFSAPEVGAPEAILAAQAFHREILALEPPPTGELEDPRCKMEDQVHLLKLANS